MNLAANARAAMPCGGKLTIESQNVELEDNSIHHHTVVAKGEFVLPEVTDTGKRIPEEHLPHIFEPFYATQESGKGTGLGLTTVYGIVKQSGGFIWVYSEAGMGMTFKIYSAHRGAVQNDQLRCPDQRGGATREGDNSSCRG